jgi:hypothetical protein
VNSSGKKVDFMICGTQKGGTTALDSYLRQHPQICMANRKEVHFFDNEDNFQGMPDYSKYHEYFVPLNSNQLLGEATPIYMYWHPSPRRIYEYNPKAKLIFLLRNPIERAFSNWNMERSRNCEELSFAEAIKNETQRCHAALPLQHRYFSYIDRGFYMTQLRRVWKYFPKKQTLVMKNEYLKHHPNDALQDLCQFLEIRPYPWEIPHVEIFSHPYESCIGEQERHYLLSIFENEIRELENELKCDCHEWLKQKGQT